MDPLTAELSKITLEKAFEHRNEIVAALMQGLKRLKTGKVSVAIFGVGGTGKSTAQLLLTEGIDKSDKNHAYIPTVTPTKKRSNDNWYVSVWDTPGQEDFRDSAWSTAFADMKSSNRIILINIVSYGYNSLAALTYSDIRRQSEKKTRDEVIRNYFRIERKKEIELVNDLVGKLREVQCKIEILTIINKQDLWWPTRNQVRKHYMEGNYRKSLLAVGHGRPKGSFSHTVKEVCLCRMNLKTSDEIVLAETSAGYDAGIREVYFTHLLAALKQLVG